MYEDRTQNYDLEIDTPFPCHIIYSHVQTIIAYL